MRERLDHRVKLVIIMPVLFIIGLIFLLVNTTLHAREWVVHPGNKNLYVQGALTYAGSVYDRNGQMLAGTEGDHRIFSADETIRKATLHVVGDLNGFIKTGLQTSYRTQLVGYDYLNGLYGGGYGDNITSTIDADLCAAALKALGSRSGAVAVMNYKTGDILCSVSAPTFDPTKELTLSEEEIKTSGYYVNRVFSGLIAPGSIFKLVTAAAALDNVDGIADMEFTCKRGVDIGGETLTCHSNHGTLSFQDALIHSCNASFAQIALKMGPETLQNYTASKLNFGGTYKVNGIKLSASKYPKEEIRDIDFGWSSIGQHHDMVNPLHYLTFVSAIANGGTAPAPSIIQSIESPAGLPRIVPKSLSTRMLPEETADTLKSIMRDTVIKNYKETRFQGLSLCAKSGTAEIEKNDRPHSWFTGFMDDEDHPYAFIVVVENGGAGAEAAANIAATVLKEAKSK